MRKAAQRRCALHLPAVACSGRLDLFTCDGALRMQRHGRQSIHEKCHAHMGVAPRPLVRQPPRNNGSGRAPCKTHFQHDYIQITYKQKIQT
jgi:hypothetical protein